MTDIDDLWKQIDKEFDEDDSIEVESFLKKKGMSKKILAETVAQSAENLVDLTFNPELLTKDTKLSKYKISKQINSGGQSEIYLAQRSDGIYEKTVVIKFIAQRYSFDILRQQFLQEMQLLADLNHPGIVQILDGGITQDQPWLVLEHIDGLHIDEYCHESNLSHRQIIKLFLSLCESLNFVHQRGVVHMDIKASNILINKINGIPYPVIIDFGIANTNDSKQQADVFGTKGFSAPEQLAGNNPNHRADIYSLGMLMAQLLTEDEVDNIGILSNKQRNDLLSKYKVKNDLIQIIHKTIQHDPNNRYQDTESLRNDLNNYLNDLPIAANQNHLGHIIVKTYKRHKLSTILSVLTILFAIGFGIKYTSDISKLQKVTNQAKNNSDELFNFMLNDLYTNLSQIGRTDILKLVTEKSIEYLHNQNSITLDAKTYLQRAKAYTNAGKVYDSLELSEQAVKTYDEAIKNLSFLSNNNKYRQSYLYQMALIKNLKSLTLTAKGQQQLTEQNLLESLQISEQLFKSYPAEDLYIKYEAHTQLGWYYMEYDEGKKLYITSILPLLRPKK